MSEFIELTTEDIFELYKDRYQAETNESMQIGSREFAEASVHAYVLSVLTKAINQSMKQSKLAFANGESLDHIADTWGIERPEGNRATCSVSMIYQGPETLTVKAYSLDLEDSNGNIFTNIESAIFDAQNTVDIAFQSVEPGSDKNNITEFVIIRMNGVVQSDFEIVEMTVTSGGTDGIDDSEEGDEQYREYIRMMRRGASVGGPAWAYEARAKAADDRIIDVYCLREKDSDPGHGGQAFTRGHADIFIITRSDISESTKAAVISAARQACEAEDFRPIGDYVTVNEALDYQLNIYTTPKLVYPLKFQNVALQHYNAVTEAYRAYLREGFNRPFSESELTKRLCTPAESGVYALEYDFGRNSTFRYDPGPGARLDVIFSADPSITFIDTGA